jgi:hypothetical protein
MRVRVQSLLVAQSMPSNRTTPDLTTTIGYQSSAIIGRADSDGWRFLIKSDKMILVSIHQDGGLSAYPPKYLYIAPNSAQEIQGKGSVILRAQNKDIAGSSAIVNTFNTAYLCAGLEPYIMSEDPQQSASGAWVDAGSLGGYPQPYTNMLRVYCDDQIRIQALDQSGTAIYSSGPQPVDEVTLQSFVAPSNLRWQIRQSVTSVTPTNFQVTWFRKEGF